jgi:sugar/nucleoside kinase (ribokinase family)
MTKATQLLGISNAIVDILAHVDYALVDTLRIVPGSMNLIDVQRAAEIYAMMGPATEMSGGSVANSVAGFANLGGSAAYIGRVKADQFGEIFNHDMRSLGVDIRLTPAAEGAPTARSHVLITPNGQRTMNTYLGACTELSVHDITVETVGTPAVILLEGYVWDLPEGPALTRRAIELGHARGAAIALSLSDSFCVERHRESFEDVVRNGVDIVLADGAVAPAFQDDGFDLGNLHDVRPRMDGCIIAPETCAARPSACVGASGHPVLERVAMRWNRMAVPSNRVNPLYIISLEQIHLICLDRKAIQTNQDLL